MSCLPFRTLRYFSIFFLFVGCSGFEKTEKEKRKKANRVEERVIRLSDSSLYAVDPPKKQPKIVYPWEVAQTYPKITSEFFRCKGSRYHPPIPGEGGQNVTDCSGEDHSLPLIRGKEGVYPILLDLLNFVQKKTGKRVFVTSGHQCPFHSLYGDPTHPRSKHQIGAEVDFYVQGMEEQPDEVLAILIDYYRSHRSLDPGWVDFAFDPDQGWSNPEVAIQIIPRDEKKDLDNRHPYPYLSIEVLYDRREKKRVAYDEEMAFEGYLKVRK